MSLFEICILVFIGFIIVYALTDRICKCIEQNVYNKCCVSLKERE